MATVIRAGLRVVRGADWQWGDQDGGEGHVGTIVEIGGQGSNKSPDKTVVVLWDSGIRCNYRAGYQGKDDLRILDNAPAGIHHANITCDICRVAGICGMRWKCTQCDDFDLCNACYMSNEHETSHTFDRFDTAVSQRVRVAARSKSRRLQAKGIYDGAIVVRGPDWKYANQDGGAGRRGTVKSIGDASSNTSWRSWVKVKWDVGLVNDYRRGADGNLDVKFVTAGNGEQYYVDHLPKLGDYGANCFCDGDSVRLVPEVLSPSDKLALMGAGLLNATGIVSISGDGQSLEVTFPGHKPLTLSTSHLVKARKLAVGDTVKILDSVQAVQKLQSGHGGWNGQMASAVGKTGKIISIDSDGDVKVDFGSVKWIFNPDCCTLVSQGQQSTQASNQTVNAGTDNGDDSDNDDNDAAVAGFVELMKLLMGAQYTGLTPDRLVKEAAEGNVDTVRAIINQHPSQVDVKSQNRTALQVAAHQGHQQIVVLLLNAGAKPEIKDDDGDTAYHYAAYGNQPAAMELLLRKTTSGLNAVNNAGRTTLHVAVCKQLVECVRTLLKYKCDVNTQDNQGDTPLHDAISKDDNTIVELLVNCGSVDFKLKNNNGFNVLQHASRHGNQIAVDKIIRKVPQFVNVAKDDGFTALHIAALNGYVVTAATLIDVGKANMEMATAKFQTPLLVAVDNGQTPIIELLVLKGANVEAEDSDGDTALHLVLLQMKNSRQASTMMTLMLNVLFQVQPKNVEKAPTIYQILQKFGGQPTAQTAWLAIACFLVVSGADVEHKNRANRSPMDEVVDPEIRALLLKLVKPKAQPKPVPAPKPQPQVSAAKPSSASDSSLCMMCTSEPIAVTFRPCGHQVACTQCSSRMKQCFSCHERIQEKVRVDIKAYHRPESARAAPSNNSASPPQPVPAQRAAPQLSETVNCPLCETNVRNVVFQCGHSCCSDCSNKTVKTNCHVCKQPIQKRINLF